MKIASLLLLTVGAVSVPCATLAFAADQGSEILALEKKLAAARDELSELKTALAIAKSQTQAAEARAQVSTQPDEEVASLKNQVRLLQQDLQSATAALKRMAADKVATEPPSARATQPLAGGTIRVAPPRPLTDGTNRETSRPADQKIAELETELAEAHSRMATAEKNLEMRDAELATLRAALATAESRPPQSADNLESVRRDLQAAQRRLAEANQELADARTQLAAARALESRVRQLEAEKEVGKNELARVSAVLPDTERQLAAEREAYALLTRDRDELRTHAAKAAEFEKHIRELEAERTRNSGTPDSNVGKDEVARLSAALASTENKLSIALRSFTLLTKERDELRARVAELSAKASAPQDKR